MAASKTLTKRERLERAREAGRKSQSIDGWITRIVNRAPDLSPEHIERLRAILPPVEHDRPGTAA